MIHRQVLIRLVTTLNLTIVYIPITIYVQAALIKNSLYMNSLHILLHTENLHPKKNTNKIHFFFNVSST